MADLKFTPMVPEENSKMNIEPLTNKLKGLLVTLVGLREYPSSTTGAVKNYTIRVGGSYEKSQLRDLVKVLQMSRSCQMDGKFWIHNDNEIRNNFYGVQYTSQIEAIFNEETNIATVLIQSSFSGTANYTSRITFFS